MTAAPTEPQPTTSGLQNQPRLVEKEDARSEIWRYFAYRADEEGNAADTSKPVCKRCHNATHAKGSNTSNLAKHLADNHPDLYQEFKERQAGDQTGGSDDSCEPLKSAAYKSLIVVATRRQTDSFGIPDSP
ncbi:E3 SUMO-protein ligase ZBED1-like [Corythoichthys intestinalis]|uniref:E3 SUMO-protein ligase ZBED1-like n=1 Tax=Corythoichthys intestinalis TaxID=161448 RepID=UPI0025A5E7B0|nr:E3 SUMO-protein ligase ZBED1-like [Corythoichthys intestinalis]